MRWLIIFAIVIGVGAALVSKSEKDRMEERMEAACDRVLLRK